MSTVFLLLKINQKVDIWALGVILYLMAYGKLPLQHLSNQYQMIFALCDPTKKEISWANLDDANLKQTIAVSHNWTFEYIA